MNQNTQDTISIAKYAFMGMSGAVLAITPFAATIALIYWICR